MEGVAKGIGHPFYLAKWNVKEVVYRAGVKINFAYVLSNMKISCLRLREYFRKEI